MANETVLSVVYLQMAGPKNALTPSGHAVQYSSPPFDETKTSPEEMAVQVAKKWQGVEATTTDFTLMATYDVNNKVKAAHSVVHLFVYNPDAEKQLPFIDHFAGSFYAVKRVAKEDTTKDSVQ